MFLDVLVKELVLENPRVGIFLEIGQLDFPHAGLEILAVCEANIGREGEFHLIGKVQVAGGVVGAKAASFDDWDW